MQGEYDSGCYRVLVLVFVWASLEQEWTEWDKIKKPTECEGMLNMRRAGNAATCFQGSMCRRGRASNGETCVLYCRNSVCGAGHAWIETQFIIRKRKYRRESRCQDSMGLEARKGKGFDKCRSSCGSQSVTHLDVLACVVAS